MIFIPVHALFVSGIRDIDFPEGASLITLVSDGLAAAGNAPKIFLRTSRNGLPYLSVIFCSLFTLLGFMGVNSGSGRVFGWFSNMTAVAGLMTWFGISFTYIRFHKGLKAQGFDRTTLPFYSRLQPFAAWYSMIACLIICVVSHLKTRTYLSFDCCDTLILVERMGCFP